MRAKSVEVGSAILGTVFREDFPYWLYLNRPEGRNCCWGKNVLGSRNHKYQCLRMCLMCPWMCPWNMCLQQGQGGASGGRGAQKDRTRSLKDLETVVRSLNFIENKLLSWVAMWSTSTWLYTEQLTVL